MKKSKNPTFSRDQLTPFLEISPFHQWLGLKFGEITADGLEIIMPWRPEIVSIPEPNSVVHGGILASLIDLAGLYAVMSQGGEPAGTAYMHVDYHRQATSGPLIARSRVLKIGKTISTAETSVFGPDQILLASGSGGYPRTPEKF